MNKRIIIIAILAFLAGAGMAVLQPFDDIQNMMNGQSKTLSATTLELAVGETAQLTLSNNTATVRWASADAGIATVDDSGTVTAVSEGSTSILVRAGLTRLSCAVSVTAAKTGTGKTICIDAGHQGTANTDTEPIGPGSDILKQKVTAGATGVSTGALESAIDLAVALKLRSELEARGYTVIMCRTSQDVDLSNAERATLANKANADAFVRLHCNFSLNASTQGASAIAPDTDNTFLSAETVTRSQNLAQCVLNGLTGKTGAQNLGVTRRNDQSGINWSMVPVSLIEMGYLSNAEEDAKLSNNDYQNLLAKGIANGIDAYIVNYLS